MNYEQKYKEALEKLQEALAPCEDGCKISGLTRDCLENIFPELKESEDERIRKELIEFLKLPHSQFVGNREHEKWIAWLEKRGDINETSAEWGEEDKQIILSIEQVMNCASVLNLVPEKIDNIKSWLKSLRPQKQWKPSTAQLIVIKDLIEDKNTSKVNKVVLRGMLDEFKQYFGL